MGKIGKWYRAWKRRRIAVAVVGAFLFSGSALAESPLTPPIPIRIPSAPSDDEPAPMAGPPEPLPPATPLSPPRELPPSTPPEPADAPAPAPVPQTGLLVEGVPLSPTVVSQMFPGSDTCSSCGSGGGGCSSCGGGTTCVPGHASCQRYPDTGTRLSRFAAAIYDGVCCPDPCYQPKWTTLANAAFFVDGARPVTQTRMRWDAGWNLLTADRSEFFWPRADGQGLGPAPQSPYKGPGRVNYNELSLYTEAATGRISVFTDMPYRSQKAEYTSAGSGFGDLSFGTKTLFVDSELFQLSLQFRTVLPTGSERAGLGVGHVTLEPSLLFGLQVSCDSFFQAQVAEWIPIGGDPGYAGSVLHYHASYNWVFARPAPGLDAIGLLEFSGYSFQDGSYSDPISGQRPAKGMTYLSFGPGVRVAFCDKLDFGIGSSIAITDPHFAAFQLRSELRFRY